MAREDCKYFQFKYTPIGKNFNDKFNTLVSEIIPFKATAYVYQGQCADNLLSYINGCNVENTPRNLAKSILHK